MMLTKLKTALGPLVVALALTLSMAATWAQQTTFATPEAAVDALTAALKANDEATLVAMFGEKYRHLVVTGDREYDANRRAEAAAMLAAFRAFDERGSNRRIVLMGTQAHPLAIPLVREGGSWRFDSEQGAEELINRRIGANERNAIQVMHAFVDAQRQYAARDRLGDGVLQYARRLGSTPGKKDGLFWDADPARGEEASPFGPLVAASSGELTGHQKGEPYRGYRFRILTGQGAHAAGGAYSYVINGRMVGGFALLAYPADYGNSGVMSFIVNHNGKVFQKNLGPEGAATASKMTRFDPGPGWTEVAP